MNWKSGASTARLRVISMKTLLAISLLFAGSLAASAQYTNTSSVLDGSGTVSSNGSLANISASGQPGGISQSSASGYVNQAGFLNTFFLKPGLLSVHGIPVEIDPDNDGDNLTDVQEITGSAFNPATPTDPNNPSTSGGGMTDGQKAIAGVNPTDGSVFRITTIGNGAGQTLVTWVAHGNNERTYVVKATTNAMQDYASVIYSNTIAGGTFPWYVTTNTISDVLPPGSRFYSVTVSQ